MIKNIFKSIGQDFIDERYISSMHYVKQKKFFS